MRSFFFSVLLALASTAQAQQVPGSDMLTAKGGSAASHQAVYRMPESIHRNVFFNTPLDLGYEDMVKYHNSGQNAQVFDHRPRVYEYLHEMDVVLDSFVLNQNTPFMGGQLQKHRTTVVVEGSANADVAVNRWTQLEWNLAFANQQQVEDAARELTGLMTDHSEIRIIKMPTTANCLYQYEMKQGEQPRYYASIQYSTTNSKFPFILITLARADL